VYVEVLRGTPLLIQIYFWFFVLPEVMKLTGWGPLIWFATLPPFVIGVIGLAVNYSANEAENYRAGLLAVPTGQTEAGLALGLSKWQTIRLVVLPQALRIVIPPVTNDFIALFKDTSICSMILITELTGLYYQYKSNPNIVMELTLTVAGIYLLISYPLAILSRRLEKK
ncbi:MAG: amino acid ABC transporter permease, partial [Gemmataceae bacterium]|nr:amino acid ABC transporter permease [Gemmataceae bacterium]